MSATDDSQDLSRTINIGVESPPSHEEGGSPEVPLIRKRKATEAGEASSYPKTVLLGTVDPIFSNLSPLSQPRSSYQISVGELVHMEVGSSHVGDVARPSSSTARVEDASEVRSPGSNSVILVLTIVFTTFGRTGGGPSLPGSCLSVALGSLVTRSSRRCLATMMLRPHSRRKGRTFFEAPTSWRHWKQEFFGVQIRRGMKWHVNIKWVDIETKSYNVCKYELGNLNKDLELMDPRILAEKRARQNARRAGLTAPSPSAVPPPTSVSGVLETSSTQPNPPLTLAQMPSQGSRPGESSSQVL
ncbi:hypothetical protein COLO4_25026 [Corchorus olitorius]|uniref:Uncharacterized protein n=1 Tax=Corchorus olitorius TaxID=93759 RepID=A0A1R3I5A7_9ROSI|nr:hypothetical protein COLO4_25026 [Corchorus olitorius]